MGSEWREETTNTIQIWLTKQNHDYNERDIRRNECQNNVIWCILKITISGQTLPFEIITTDWFFKVFWVWRKAPDCIDYLRKLSDRGEKICVWHMHLWHPDSSRAAKMLEATLLFQSPLTQSEVRHSTECMNWNEWKRNKNNKINKRHKIWGDFGPRFKSAKGQQIA